jgi:hypothetical protein
MTDRARYRFLFLAAALALAPAAVACGPDGPEGELDGETDADAPGDAPDTETGVDAADGWDDGPADAPADSDASDDVPADPDLEPDGPALNPLLGAWVWAEQIEGGETVLTITHEDMIVKVGPDGWPDCPSGIICTRYGIRKLKFDEDGSLTYIHNVHTSSDYQFKGTYTVDGDLVSYSFDEHFSCAHPDVNDTELRSGFFRFRVEEGNLAVSVSGFSGSLQFFSEPPTDPQMWVSYRPISQDDYDNTYMIRVCMAADDADCHPDCFPEKYGTMF